MDERRRRQLFLRLVCLYIVFILPQVVNADRISSDRRLALIEILPRQSTLQSAAPSGEKPTRSKADEPSAFAKLLHGVFARVGSAQDSNGALVNFPSSEGDDEDAFLAGKPPGDWVAVLNYSPSLQPNDTAANGMECLFILDRVKKAMLFGASAIIILTMNPNILKELDIAQLFSSPVVIVEDAGNVTILLQVIRSGFKMRVKITYGPSLYDTQTFTIWSACWRARPGSGVVCMSDSRLSKVNPSLFWSYFYSALAVIMLLLLIKTSRPSRHAAESDDEIMEDQLIGAVARQALSFMKVKRYRKVVCNHDDSERDTCAICLDRFYRRQKIRILPCVHEFHLKCVDPWLLRRPVCPLCKLNVLENRHFREFPVPW